MTSAIEILKEIVEQKKSFWDWLWNWQIRARTSRKREGCSWKYYKSCKHLEGR